MPSKIKSFVFEISSLPSFKGTPIKKHIANELDYAADIVSIKRLSDESNADFKQRVFDVTVHPGGPTYTGIINGLSRDLGFIRKLAFTIDVLKDANGDTIASSPRVLILANRVILYSNWRPDGTATIDKEIRIYQPEDDGFYLEDLVAEIDSSSYFSATINPDVRPNLHSSSIIREDSLNIVFGDYIGVNKKHNLAGQYICPDSITFEKTDFIFDTEISWSPPSSAGQYYVDYTNGTIETYSEPQENAITYYHNVFPLNIDWTPIQVYSLTDEDFVDELFTVETLQSGEEVRKLPNAEGAEIYHTLYKETNNLWGK